MQRPDDAGLRITLRHWPVRGNVRFLTLHISDQALQRSMALVARDDRALAPAARAL